ncbi:NAD(P)-binding domain-containing protein [Promicromonospora iranensis]|uniref:Dinucleotide-binding enzyme n=1 Tax=Promicromonospora iranensis TaxID=1105144 RepID=A0ABU2CTR9_9MICO|nr:NAD(P)-binding domain-containing protein [Promicromonospora iranensis]MDR7384744.1 putative dinucleotide-binding enzyme [Promicromonospora iranensis]
MSSITLIGTGNMARAIGTRAVAGGNSVEVMGRDQSKADDLAEALGGATTGPWGAQSLGLRPLDAGGLKMAHWLEGMGVVTVGLAGNGVGHGDFALGVNEATA